MMALNPVIHKTVAGAVHQGTLDKQIYFAFGVGMAMNLAAIYIGNPYLMTLLVLPVALIATIKWLHRPLPWITLASVVAANPVNLNATVAFNLIFALFLLIFNLRNFKRLPPWLYPVLIFASISIVGSVVSWGETGGLFTQLAAVGNYVLGPFLLIPLIYFRLRNESDTGALLKILVLALILPTVSLMLLARMFGTPVFDVNSTRFDYLVNISVYHLGNVDFQLTRTQVGFPLAVLICTTFAVVISEVNRYLRLFSLAVLATCIFLLLVTGSIGSSLSALCGIAVILIIAARYIQIKKYLVLISVMIALAMFGWTQIPHGIKDYAESRIEEKLSGSVDISDRSVRWQASFEYLLENPLGRGWDLYVAPIGVYPHNDYISYSIAFGVICGLIYLLTLMKIMLAAVYAKTEDNINGQAIFIVTSVGVVSVVMLNSFVDHLTANRWYFNVVWSIVWYSYFSLNHEKSAIYKE